MRDKLETSSAGQDKLSSDLKEANAKLEKLEIQIHQLTVEREAACSAANDAESEAHMLTSEMETIREKYEAQYEALKNTSEAQLQVDHHSHTEGVGFLPEASLQAEAEQGGYSPRYHEDAKRRSDGFNELIRKRLDMDSHADSLAGGDTTALAGGRMTAQPSGKKDHSHHATSEFLNTAPLTDEELSEIMGMM
eukprot:jgi/Pico_ML_1/51876/g2699.t1